MGWFAQQINFPMRMYWRGVSRSLYTPFERVQALFPPFTSRIRLPASFRVEAGRILASIRSPRLCPLCQRRRRNYFAATVDGNAVVWVRRRSREAALACLPRISYFLSSIRLRAHGTRFQEEVGQLLPFQGGRWLNWTGEFFPISEHKIIEAREEMTIVVRSWIREREKIGLFETIHWEWMLLFWVKGIDGKG